MDDWHIGIRHNGDYALSILAEVFAGARVADSRAPDNFSVALYEPTARGSRELHLLVRGSRKLVRSRSAARVMSGLLQYLTADLYPTPPGLMIVPMAAVIRDGHAFFVPTDVNDMREQAQPRLAKAGFQMLDVPHVYLDPATNELVIPEPAVAYDRAALAALDEGMRLGNELPNVSPGRYPLDAWVLATDKHNTGPISTARAVASLLPATMQQTDDLDSAVQDLVAIMKHSRVIGAYYETMPELVKELAKV